MKRIRSRRSFLAQAVGGSLAGAAALVLGGPDLAAQDRPGQRRLPVDADPGDPAHSGLSDSDSGSQADPAGNGRGGPEARRRGVSDADRGSAADPARRGRGPAHRSAGARPPFRGGSVDTDSGASADATGRGGSPSPGRTAARPAPRPAPRERFVICPGNRRCPR